MNLKEEVFRVNYSEIIIELEKASLFDLSRLASVIRNELANPERIDKVKKNLISLLPS